MKKTEPLFHIVAINEKTEKETYLTCFPMNHYKACIMMKKFSYNKFRRIQLKEA